MKDGAKKFLYDIADYDDRKVEDRTVLATVAESDDDADAAEVSAAAEAAVAPIAALRRATQCAEIGAAESAPSEGHQSDSPASDEDAEETDLVAAALSGLRGTARAAKPAPKAATKPQARPPAQTTGWATSGRAAQTAERPAAKGVATPAAAALSKCAAPSAQAPPQRSAARAPAQPAAPSAQPADGSSASRLGARPASARLMAPKKLPELPDGSRWGRLDNFVAPAAARASTVEGPSPLRARLSRQAPSSSAGGAEKRPAEAPASSAGKRAAAASARRRPAAASSARGAAETAVTAGEEEARGPLEGLPEAGAAGRAEDGASADPARREGAAGGRDREGRALSEERGKASSEVEADAAAADAGAEADDLRLLAEESGGDGGELGEEEQPREEDPEVIGDDWLPAWPAPKAIDAAAVASGHALRFFGEWVGAHAPPVLKEHAAYVTESMPQALSVAAFGDGMLVAAPVLTELQRVFQKHGLLSEGFRIAAHCRTGAAKSTIANQRAEVFARWCAPLGGSGRSVDDGIRGIGGLPRGAAARARGGPALLLGSCSSRRPGASGASAASTLLQYAAQNSELVLVESTDGPGESIPHDELQETDEWQCLTFVVDSADYGAPFSKCSRWLLAARGGALLNMESGTEFLRAFAESVEARQIRGPPFEAFAEASATVWSDYIDDAILQREAVQTRALPVGWQKGILEYCLRNQAKMPTVAAADALFGESRWSRALDDKKKILLALASAERRGHGFVADLSAGLGARQPLPPGALLAGPLRGNSELWFSGS
ncbi:unnamed protein product, partial [Prorocentrum cordatum]